MGASTRLGEALASVPVDTAPAALLDLKICSLHDPTRATPGHDVPYFGLAGCPPPTSLILHPVEGSDFAHREN